MKLPGGIYCPARHPAIVRSPRPVVPTTATARMSAQLKTGLPLFTPPRIHPPAKPLKRLAFLAAFVRNPLQVAPQAVYDEDFVSSGRGRRQRAWVTSPALIKAVLLDQREKFQKITQIRLLSPLL